jgi:excisionase family DNA binding protein
MENKKTQVRLLRIKEAADYLAISERTLWTLHKEGRIPAIHFRRTTRFDMADLAAFIERCKNG